MLETWTIFIDGACEEFASVGGVLVNPTGSPVFMFGVIVPDYFNQCLYMDSAHPIYEVELLPLLIVATLWQLHLDKCQAVFCTWTNVRQFFTLTTMLQGLV